MRRSELFSALAALCALPLVGSAQPWLTREGDLWVRTFNDTASAKPRLRINAHGPVTLNGNASREFAYTVKVSVKARTRERARAILERATVRLEQQGEWTVLTTPGGIAMSSVVMKAPRLQEAYISTSDGAVEANGIDGDLHVDTGADQVKADRIHGDCTLATGAGEIHVGQVDGSLHCTTQAGAITARAVRGEAVLQTNGGDVEVLQVGGSVRVESGGGNLHIGVVNGSVSAINGGGTIIVDRAMGNVTMHNMAGPVRVGAAAGIRCDSAPGGVQLANITGPMRVSTATGNILANLLGSRLAESYLATGNGDITVVIPSNVSVTISAVNELADSVRRIVSDFRDIQPHVYGTRLVAEGRVNGGGPLLQISASSGTIFLKRP